MMMNRPFRSFRVAVVTASVAAVTALGVTVAKAANTQSPLYDLATAPVVTPSLVRSAPDRPEPHPASHTRRETDRETLTSPLSARMATPSTRPAKRHSVTTPPADIRIGSYRNCSAQPQPCIDGGALTMYAGNILAGHDYMGYQWLSRVPVGRTVDVISGPLEGAYKVYDHLTISRQGGSVPTFPGSPSLVLQTCEGSMTAFSLLHRV
jgi:hypothetical protein